MGTINSREIVDEIIKGDGYYSDDERVVKIVEYMSNWNTQCFGLVYESEVLMGMGSRYNRPTDFVRNPKTIWELTVI